MAQETEMATKKMQKQPTPEMVEMAEKFMGQINANVDAYYVGTLSHAEFHAVAVSLWDAAKSAGVSEMVRDMIRTEERERIASFHVRSMSPANA
jgi:hypothetical protein